MNRHTELTGLLAEIDRKIKQTEALTVAVGDADTVKGYQFAKDQYAIIDTDEIDKRQVENASASHSEKTYDFSALYIRVSDRCVDEFWDARWRGVRHDHRNMPERRPPAVFKRWFANVCHV